MLKNKSELDLRMIQYVSGNILSKMIPDNWNELSEEERFDFVGENTWETFEDIEPEAVLEIINDNFDSLKRFIKNYKKDIENFI
jgi:hypothetical protein